MPHTTMACRRCTTTTRAPRRGLCTGCYWHARNQDQLVDYPRTRPQVDLEEVAFLRSQGQSRADIAATLGVTDHAVRVAEWRAARTEAGERR